MDTLRILLILVTVFLALHLSMSLMLMECWCVMTVQSVLLLNCNLLGVHLLLMLFVIAIGVLVMARLQLGVSCVHQTDLSRHFWIYPVGVCSACSTCAEGKELSPCSLLSDTLCVSLASMSLDTVTVNRIKYTPQSVGYYDGSVYLREGVGITFGDPNLCAFGTLGCFVSSDGSFRYQVFYDSISDWHPIIDGGVVDILVIGGGGAGGSYEGGGGGAGEVIFSFSKAFTAGGTIDVDVGQGGFGVTKLPVELVVLLLA